MIRNVLFRPDKYNLLGVSWMKKWLPVFAVSLIFLNACGGGGDDKLEPKNPDDDNDTIINTQDNCPLIANLNQLDTDGDGIGDACDTADLKQQALNKINQYATSGGTSAKPEIQDYIDAGVTGVTVENIIKLNQTVSELGNEDTDTLLEIQEILNDLGIVIPEIPEVVVDLDEDGIKDSLDNCPGIANPDQKDTDEDGIGDVCDTIEIKDDDEDTIANEQDNCPSTANPNQSDIDKDGIGDACDTKDDRDGDNDSVINSFDNCPKVANPDQKDVDKNGIGDACDTTDMTDDDNDGIINILDNCPLISNPDQADKNNNGKGDVCDIVSASDSDGDGVPDSSDEFPADSSRAASVTSAYRLLTQATFGVTEGEIDRIVSIGTDAWISDQLSRPSAYDSATDNHKTHLERTIEITKLVEPNVDWYEDGIFNQKSSSRLAFYQMSDWWENTLGHPTNTRHGSDQLRQRVAYGLSQIMVTSALQPRLSRRSESLSYYHDLLAKNAFGNYRTLLGEMSRSATMGVYLSHQGNNKANPAEATRPDENFARELIQLFAIGLYELNQDGSPNRDLNTSTYPDAGDTFFASYTQNDVEEMAKVMTGWDLKGNKYFGRTSTSGGEYASSMVFDPEHHEDEVAEGGDGNVTILGTTFPLNSGADGSGMDAALDLLFNHVNMAPFVSKRLISYLVTSNPSSAYVARVAATFNDNGSGVRGDLKSVIKAILTDTEARDNGVINIATFGKVKEPILAWTQLLRTFEVTTVDGWKGPGDENGNKALVNGVYAYRKPESDFGQAPFRSKHVFNFYQPDYVPSDTYFSNNRLVAPETQIQTDQTLVEINNTFYDFVKYYEKNRITKLDNKTLTEFANSKSVYSSHLMLIDFDRELDIFEQALDGDTNGDFSNMEETDPADSIPYKEKAVNALLDHLNKIMLGDTMTTEYRAILRHYLLNASGLSSSNNFKEALYMIRDSVRFITTSSAFMIQK